MALEPFTLLYLLHGTCKYLTLYTYCLIYSLFLLELFLAYSGHSIDICCCYLVAEFVTPWTMAHQALLSMGFPRQEYHLPFPSPGDLPNPGTGPASLHCRQILHC